MQPSMDHFGELRQLLHKGQYENDGRQPVIPRSTRARPAEQLDTLVFSAHQHPAARPPLARPGVAAATRSRRPPPAPVAPHQGSTNVPVSRHAANRNDVDLYLAQLNYHQPSQQQDRATRQVPSAELPPATATAAAQQPAPEQHRRAKRGKPMARRSLQALFDLAAEDSSTWQTSGASTAGGDTEDDGDTGFFASATSGDSSLLLHNNTTNNTKPSPLASSVSDADADAVAAAAVLARLPGPSTPANCDSGLLGEAVAVGTLVPGSRPAESPLDAATTTITAGGAAKNSSQDCLSSIVPLRHLLMSERGRKLTALEAKAIILRVAEDLAALHAANAVHRRVSIESISLTTCLPRGSNTTTTTTTDAHNGDGNSRPSTSNAAAAAPQEENGIAVAILPPGRSAAVLGSNRCYWALKDPVFDAEHAPPEVACCPIDRPVAFTPAGDMWALGVVLFSLLSGGRLPFSTPSCLCGIETETGGVIGDAERANSSTTVMASTVDALQCRLHNHITCQLDVINQLSAAQAAGTAGIQEKDFLEMAAIGFDSLAKKLLLGLLHADPAQRFCAEDVLNHPWVAEAIPFVPKMHFPSSFQFKQKSISASPGGADNNNGGNNYGRRETSPPMSDVLRRTEQLGFTPQSANTNPSTLTAPAAPAECPYPIIGHVAQPLEVTVAGRKVIISALHAVYNVPGHGAMMSAAPLAVADPAEVSAAAAAAAANGHLHMAAEQGNTGLSQYLNLGGAS